MMIAVRIARALVDWIAAPIGALDRFGKRAARQRLVGEGLQRAHRADQLGGIGRGVGKRVLRRARAAPHRAAEADQRQHDQRDGGQHEARQLRARDHHHGGGAEKQHEVAERDRHRRADRRLDLRGVGGEPRGQLAGPRGVEERRRERDEMARTLRSARRPPRARRASSRGSSGRRSPPRARPPRRASRRNTGRSVRCVRTSKPKSIMRRTATGTTSVVIAATSRATSAAAARPR